MSTHPTTAYAQAVINDEILACKFVKQSCQRHLDDLERSDVYFDEEAASHALDFYQFTTHIKGVKAGTPIELEPWQQFIVGSVFGWKRTEDDLRRYRTAYVEVARKNGKSALLSGIGLYLTGFDGEGGAEVYSAATTREQARIVFNDAKLMAERSPVLRRLFGTHKLNIHVMSTASKFEPLSADANSLDGLNVHGGLIDELHAHKTRDVWDVIETATGARTQPLMFAITTAGFNRNGICYELREYLAKVLQGVVDDDSIFGVIYTLDDEDSWLDESVWLKANPNLGVSVRWDDIQRLAKKAKEMTTARNNFLTKRLNVWVNAESAWLDMEKWERCPPLADDAVLSSAPCVVGLDLANKLDVAAAVAVFEVAGELHVKCRFWLPTDAIEIKARSIGNKYQAWAESGYLTLTEGAVIDHEVIEEDLRCWLAEYSIEEIAFDPWGSVQLATRLASDGAPMVELPQTTKNFSEAMKEVEALVISGRLHHGDNPMLTWMMSNVTARVDANENVFPRKEHPDNKIDGAVAMFSAVSRILRRREAAPSVYESEGLLLL